MNETTLNGQTPDIAEENIAKLREIFPDVFSEKKVDFDKLKQVLGEYIEDADERYNFTWNGKSKALHLAQTPSTGTLRPCKEESKNWDTTQNLYIEGDNLEVLKLLQKSYHGKIKMIYIDPPYNTGHDFVYKDDYRDNIQNYLEITGQVDGEGRKLGTNSESSGRYHTDWLNMMYPRLRLARNLLSDDGVIFISIDDDEISNIRRICDEILGEDNLVNCFVWNCSTAGGIRPKFASKTHEYILCYAKNKLNLNTFYAPLSTDAKKMYTQEDQKGKYRDKDFVFKNKSTNANQKYFIKCPDGEMVQPKEGYIYRFVNDRFQEALNDGLVTFKQTTTGPLVDTNGHQAHWNIYIKKYLGDAMGAPSTLIPKEMMSIYNVGTQCIQNLFDNIRVFENAKPVDVISYFINMITQSNDIILDFFSGSATTAHAVMQLNAEDGGKRRFICVQLPESTDENSEAYKAGYKNICEIGKERIRRAGDKINGEITSKNTQLEIGEDEKQPVDIGFKVFKLDSSNIKKWNPDYDNLEISLLDSVENLVDGRSESDLAYEIMLKYGLDLTYPMDELDCGGKKIYSVGFGMLVMCMADDVTTDVAQFIADYKKENDIDEMRVVFKDTCFKDDSTKTNIKEILKCAGVEEFVTV